MTWKILSVAASAAMALLGLFIGVASSDAGSILYGYVISISEAVFGAVGAGIAVFFTGVAVAGHAASSTVTLGGGAQAAAGIATSIPFELVGLTGPARA